ncbi:unnamed protein product [Ceutorhynchus assimilis]|uniref:RRM domain-containing protein n=1 Tax=Ceutorhynchus assimilis TaxID=467358 RepID=A0A9N9MBK6_9CUCU|nr:unnamed protein product [Ceutorhynchus assimilis]
MGIRFITIHSTGVAYLRLCPFLDMIWGRVRCVILDSETSHSSTMSRYNSDCKVYVGDLGNSASKQEIEDAFRYYGPLRNVWVARNPPGFAFVEFEDPRDAEDAMAEAYVEGELELKCLMVKLELTVAGDLLQDQGGVRFIPRIGAMNAETGVIMPEIVEKTEEAAEIADLVAGPEAVPVIVAPDPVAIRGLAAVLGLADRGQHRRRADLVLMTEKRSALVLAPKADLLPRKTGMETVAK